MVLTRTLLKLPQGGSSIGLLRLLLVMSVAGPVLLFALLAWVEYRNTMEDGRRELERLSDVAREHAEKAFEGQAQTIERISDLLRGLDRDSIRRSEGQLHDAIGRIIAHLPHLQSAVAIDTGGWPVVSATSYPAEYINLRNTDYFQGVMGGAGKQFVSRVQVGPILSRPFFGLAGPWWSDAGTLNGVIDVAVAPAFFEEFYAALARQTNGEAGKTVALLREDGQLLVRYPPLSIPLDQIPRSANFSAALRESPEAGIYRARSVVASSPGYRLFAYRKVDGYPVYIVAGLGWPELLQDWYGQLLGHLAFGVPATAALFLVARLALRRAAREEAALARAEAEVQRRHEAEEVLLRSQRLEAVGQLTGGVAHDFNNLLTIISGNAEMIDRRTADPTITRLANSISLAARRGADITQKLLAFSGRQIVNPEIVDLNRRLEEFKLLLDRAASEAVEVALDLEPALWAVRLDPGQFEAAILNVVGNARDAMPDGGRIFIRTGNLELPDLADDDLPSGYYVRVVVTDTGHGMDQATAARAFEPFFTTKEVGRGTGLGLSQVYGFARQSGGTARITTSPGRGTSVTFILPRSLQVARTQPAIGPEPMRRAPDGEVVLVVEDEPSLREMAVGCLEAAGYQLLTAADGPAAMQVLRSRARVDILFTDILMPGGMNGVQLGREARALRPELVLVMTSGASASAAHELPADVPLLVKPYECGELSRQIGAALSRRTMVAERPL